MYIVFIKRYAAGNMLFINVSCLTSLYYTQMYRITDNITYNLNLRTQSEIV